MFYRFKNKLFNFLFQYWVIILGFIMFATYIYMRFIHERLPKNIPFSFSVLGFFIVLELCIIYLYIVFRLIVPTKKPNEILQIFIDIFYKPLEDFDYFWKHNLYISPYYNNFMAWFIYKLQYILNDKHIFYLIFMIFPRIILISVFMLDILYFNQLKYIYYFLFLGILLFLRRYIIYSIKMYKKDLYTPLNLYAENITTRYVFGVHSSEYPENYDPEDEDNDEIPPTMSLPLDIFIAYYIKSKVYDNITPNIQVLSLQEAFYDKYSKIFNIPNNQSLTPIAEKACFAEEFKLRNNLKKVLKLEILLEYYKISSNDKFLNYIKTIIFSSYFLSWLYILIVSRHSLNVNDLITVINLTYLKIEEPFSFIIMEEIEKDLPKKEYILKKIEAIKKWYQ